MTALQNKNDVDWLKWESPDILWWPWLVALAFYEKKVGIKVTRDHLIKMGRRGYFKSGKDANCPSRLVPVDRASFVNWVQGNGKQPRRTR